MKHAQLLAVISVCTSVLGTLTIPTLYDNPEQSGDGSYTSLGAMDKCSFRSSAASGEDRLPEFVVEKSIPTISVSSNLYDSGATCGMCIYVTPTGTGSSTGTETPATNFASVTPFFAFVTNASPSIGGSDFEIDQIGGGTRVSRSESR